MNETTPQSAMTEFNKPQVQERRRSPRLSSPLQVSTNNKINTKMAVGLTAVTKRSIVVRKIAPRKTVAPSEQDKENTPRPSGLESIQEKKQKISTPTNEAPTRVLRSSSGKKKEEKKAAMPSPILPSSPPKPSSSSSSQPEVDPEDAVWSQKVRRSYSRLSDQSVLHSPDRRETLFGFDKLQTPEVIRPGSSRSVLGLSSGSLCGLSSFTSMMEAEDCGSVVPELDLNIPGVVVVKEKKVRRKKVQQIGQEELDALAAKMNAEFEEADEFELTVE